MNAKRANQIIQDIEALSGQTKEYPLAYWEAKQLLTDTKAAEPLLGVIEILRENLRLSFCQCEAHLLNSYCPNDLALASSAQVVEKYRKETLGE